MKSRRKYHTIDANGGRFHDKHLMMVDCHDDDDDDYDDDDGLL